jgi:hypothetical protein
MAIIDEQVRDLVRRIEAGDEADKNLRKLVRRLQSNCRKPAVKRRYASYSSAPCNIGNYPLEQGFAKAFDPLTEEQEFVKAWFKHGIVVGKNILPAQKCAATIRRMHEIVADVSKGKCDLDKPLTYEFIPRDGAGVPMISRSFFEVYHDDALAQIRQSVRLYLHYVLLWGRADLWVTFDRFGIKLPHHEESGSLPLHVDQNPNVHPEFRTVQGVIALVDCPQERGTYVGVPGSRVMFKRYARMAKNRGEYIELDLQSPLAGVLKRHAQPLPLRAGCMVSWDSRTTHANTANSSGLARYVVYQAAGPAGNAAAAAIRKEAFRTGLGSNVRDALMHASKKPRYTSPAALQQARKKERLNLLGKLLYGWASYEEI